MTSPNLENLIIISVAIKEAFVFILGKYNVSELVASPFAYENVAKNDLKA